MREPTTSALQPRKRRDTAISITITAGIISMTVLSAWTMSGPGI